MKAWVERYARLLNVEFDWESDLLPEVATVEGPSPPDTTDLIRKVLGKIKCVKAACTSGIIAEMLKATGEVGKELIEVVFCNGVIPTDWQESFILNLYKGKGDALERENCRILKLTDQVMKLFERVFGLLHLKGGGRACIWTPSFERWWTMTPCILALGRGTINAILIIRV